MSKGQITVRAARWSATHPWRAIGMWVVLVVACFAIGAATGTKKSDSNGDIGEVTRSEQIVKDGQFADPDVESVLITAPSGQLDQTKAGQAAATVSERMRALGGVADVAQPMPSPNKDALIVRVTLKEGGGEDKERVQPLLDATADVQKQYPDLRIEEVGGLSIGQALQETLGEDFKRAEMFSLPITLAILLIAFGALIAAAVPLLLALSAVAAAIGLSAAASQLVPAVDAVNSVILLIGMAVGVDYSLFYLRREREERAKGRGHVDAVEIAAATSGHAVVVSGTAVIISMAGLFLARDTVFSSFAVGSILVVAVAVIGSLTVLPAVLAKLGRWVDKPRIPLVWRLTAGKSEPKFWPTVLKPALKHPIATLLVAVVALLAVASPALGMTLKFPGTEDLPRTTPVMQAYDRLTAAFPSTGTSHQIAVKAPAGQAPAVKAALAELVQRTKSDKLFAQDGLQEPRVSKDGTVATLEVATPFDGGSDEARGSLTKLRTELMPQTVGKVTGVEYAVGGFVAADVDYAAHTKSKLPLVIGFVLLLTMIVMMVTFRSVVVALTAIGLNLLSAGAAYGVVTAVFQNTWAEGILDFRSNGAVVSWLPLFLFVVLFGLSMDYHVFVVSRIREAVLRGVPTKQAVAEGITGSAGVVTSAAAVMIGVFAVFATLSTLDMKQLGVGLAVAILIDATIIRAVVLPSAMILLGDANWWAPRWLRPRPAKHAATPTPDPDRELTPVG
ncbi:MMPL family transporter [Kribbella sandramycini]|uniref:MMPL family transporter n=1 Tax=Kribbella sandramycini TaxID=60450 RepID=A0A7Y4L4L9_9ACTN|nr:MMPL family transporter [Kribbella sandramycini]MBB6571248.1 RND superfamily putative drug exporter [Kribbella sandramycini]NOL43346.1 MMPL family transporter [Kribbella sandramycini]